MNGTCDWPGCTARAEIGYKVKPDKPRELCQSHMVAFYEIQERRGDEVAWRKLDTRRREEVDSGD